MSKQELVEILVTNHGYNKDDIKSLNLDELTKLVQVETDEVIEDDDGLTAFDTVELDEDEDNSSIEEHIPRYTDPAWNHYVLQQFADEELDEAGRPKVDGLRRIVEVLRGEILASRTIFLQPPDSNNGFRASATVEIMIATEGGDRVFCGSGDAYDGNISGPEFAKHLVAMAETRAEVRALRRILRLRAPASEEMASGTPPETIAASKESINGTQLTMIDILCKNNDRGLNINVPKLVLLIHNLGNISTDIINKLTETDGQAIIKYLSAKQNDKESVSEDIKGYEENWSNR